MNECEVTYGVTKVTRLYEKRLKRVKLIMTAAKMGRQLK
jgi:hypothetical protein